MPRFPHCFLLALAAHVGLGWLLHDPRDESGIAVQAPQPMMVQLVGPEPAAVAAPAPPSAPARAAEAAKTPRHEATPRLVSKARPEPAKPVERAEPARPQPVAAAGAEPSRPETAAAASAPAAKAAAAKSVVTEVFSREPAFLRPPKPPVYPAQARRRNQQGLVLVEVRLDARGLLREIRLLRSSGVESLDRSALDAVAVWRFRPETQNGQPVPSRVHIPIEFALSASR